MKVLVACEYSGRVRNAFRARGVEAFSCDLLPSEDNSPYHFTGPLDIYLHKQSTPKFDLMIAHPPCTHFANSGARWLKRHWVKKKTHPDGGYWHDPADKLNARARDLIFVQWLLDSNYLNIKLRAIENPPGSLSTLVGPPDQTFQPHWFGEPRFKATCLRLRGGLPPLKRTHHMKLPTKADPAWKEWNEVHYATPGPDRWKDRSRTYVAVAEAMAEQWSRL